MTTRIVAEYQFFTVNEIPLQPGRKTHDYALLNRRSGTCIGVVAWYGPWRQWCFFPGDESVWSDGCLSDVQDFLAKLKAGQIK